MRNRGKRWRNNQAKFDREKRYDVAEAIGLLKSTQAAKFNETVEVALRLGVDPKKSDQMVRGVVQLPHGTGRTTRILVFAKGEQETAAREAGADFVGSEDLIEKIKGGWLEFDKAIATPDMMGKVGAIAKVLGPRGLMPNPKVGTVTKDVAKAVKEQKAGSIEFRVEKAGIIHAPVGKISFDAQKLNDNFMALIEQVVRVKPPTAKGIYLQSITLTSTMGPGIRIDPAKAQSAKALV
jgi:large subunit ribosomal protein L1